MAVAEFWENFVNDEVEKDAVRRPRALLGLCLLGCAVLVSVCESAGAQVSVRNNVAYLEGKRSEKMDIYLPKHPDSSQIPAVLLIHGGGWVEGDKADKRGVEISTSLANSGYAVFAINYRLADPKAAPGSLGAYPQNLFDAKSGLRFIRLNAVKYGVDPAKIAVMGESAGGHLALLMGETMQDSPLNEGGFYTEQSNQISCLVDLYGVANLKDSKLNFVRGPFQGRTDHETDANIDQANPMEHLVPSLPPVLIFHGTADHLVPISQSRSLMEKMKAKGLLGKLVEVPGAGHSFDLQPNGYDLRPVVVSFLQACFRTKAPQ